MHSSNKGSRCFGKGVDFLTYSPKPVDSCTDLYQYLAHEPSSGRAPSFQLNMASSKGIPIRSHSSLSTFRGFNKICFESNTGGFCPRDCRYSNNSKCNLYPTS